MPLGFLFLLLYFISFAVIINEIVFFTSLSDILLQYRNTSNFYIDFCVLQLCYIHLLFIIVFFGGVFSLYRIMSSTNSNSFTSSFPIWMAFVSFSYLIALARTSSTTLNNSGKSGYLCLVPDLRGKALSFSPLNVMLAEGLSYVAFILLRYFSSIHILLCFLLKDGCHVL